MTSGGSRWIDRRPATPSTPALAAELAAAFSSRPEDTRTVLLLGNGQRFCVGGDVQSFGAAEDPGAFVGQLAHDWHEVIRLLLATPVPVVAGVQGAVAGAGLGLIGACDIVVCARGTKLRPATARSASPPTAARPGRSPAPSARPARSS